MSIIDYPFDAEKLLLKKKSLKKSLLNSNKNFYDKKIAVLGGSTTGEFVSMIELFLLNYGIKPEFYESDYNMYWQNAMFGNDTLANFKPDIIYIHTSAINITNFPNIGDSKEKVAEALQSQYCHFENMWEKLAADYKCPIIQNNFERPVYRLLGNSDISSVYGKSHFISQLNQMFYGYAQNNKNFYINDIDYLASDYGLEKWQNMSIYYMYKYICAIEAIPAFAFSVSNIIKSIYGLNKKAFILDLDNTLWGGVIGDDGIEGISIGHEVATGEAYCEFQTYIKAHKDIGVMLNICSKNDLSNAILGLGHMSGVLRQNDFISIKANWDSKDNNIKQIAKELNLDYDSFVFLDDNPAEREIVSTQLANVAAPNINTVEKYIQVIDRGGYFETTVLSGEDLKRNEMYKANIQRESTLSGYTNYDDYLKSLDMCAYIYDFDPIHLDRVTQLTNKTNQFNLTTKRYTKIEMENISKDNGYIRIVCKLTDKFGDNGIVSVIIGRIDSTILHIELWLMSCRVIKRGVEEMMFDVLVSKCSEKGIKSISGYYLPTAKNAMVKDLYSSFGFEQCGPQNSNITQWAYDISKYSVKNTIIKMDCATASNQSI